jgi:HNH endonuclease
MNTHYPPVAARAGHRCEYCHAPEPVFNFPFEVEHVAPVSRGGRDDQDNMALACRSCNLFKSDHLTATDPETGAVVDLFDPRRETWAQHFQVETETGVILGRTPSGRATIARLQINSSAQQAARRQWMQLGLFP